VSGSGISWAICKSAPRCRDNHASTPPLSFLLAGCPSCRPTNSVKALKTQDGGKNQLWNKITSLSPCVYSSFWGISPQTRLHPRPPSLPLARSSGSATDSATACCTGLASRFNGVNACDSFSKSQSYYDDTATIYAFQCGAGTFRTHTSVVPGVETIHVLRAERCAPTGGANYLMLLIIPPRLRGGL